VGPASLTPRTGPIFLAGAVAASVAIATSVSACGTPQSHETTFERQADLLCDSYVKSLPPPHRLAPTYRLEVSGLRHNIEKRRELIAAIEHLASPPADAAVVGDLLASLRAIDPLELAGLRHLQRTRSPILPPAVGRAWGAAVRRAQRFAQRLGLPRCIDAADE
jgi:hypothetical protein